MATNSTATTTTVAATTQATADAASAPRKFDVNTQGVPSRKQAALDRVSWRNFDPDRVTAIFENNEGKAVLLGEDSQPNSQSSVEIEPPPLLMKRKSQIFGEGDAFKEVLTDGQKQKISRARAHFRALFRAEVSEETQKIYPDWPAMQTASFEKIHKASMNILRATMKWRQSAKWIGPIESAEKLALAFMASKLPAGSEDWDDLQKMTAIKQSPELLKQFEDRMFAEYVKKARYPTKPMKAKNGQVLPPSVGVEAKVYATKDYAGGTYDKDAMGPSDVTIPSNSAKIHKAIDAMAKLPGPGGVGIDCREFSPITFIDDRKKKGEKGYTIERPTVQLEGGEVVPDYWFNPTRIHKGKSCQAYCTLVFGFVVTSSAQGGYGVKFIWKNRHILKIVHREEVPEREMESYARKRGLNEDSSDDEDYQQSSAAEPEPQEHDTPATKRVRMTTTDTSQPQQEQPKPADDLYGFF